VAHYKFPGNSLHYRRIAAMAINKNEFLESMMNQAGYIFSYYLREGLYL
jgi:hypothetical protein